MKISKEYRELEAKKLQAIIDVMKQELYDGELDVGNYYARLAGVYLAELKYDMGINIDDTFDVDRAMK